MNNQLSKLRSLLEGKTILKIEEPGASEAIAKFIMMDGSAFRLHATELGFWMEETISSNAGFYPSLTGLAIDYGHYMYNLMPHYNFNPPPANSIIEDDAVIFLSPDDKRWRIKLSSLSETEKNIIKHIDACFELCNSLLLGDMWMIPFYAQNAQNGFPDNCLFDTNF